MNYSEVIIDSGRLNIKGGGIRRALPQDAPHFYEICLKTAACGTGGFSDPYMIGHYYAAPYLFCPSCVCFTAELDFYPCGYIVCAPDTAAFNKWLEETWLPPLRKRYGEAFQRRKPRSEFEKNTLRLFFENAASRETPGWLQLYPAHIHVNLLPEAQGGGFGSALIGKVKDELSALGARGVHLGVSLQNTAAQAFYAKNGFQVLQKEEWGLFMGSRLDAE